ncbi:Hypothetical protein GbCGDNIH9_8422 [Granulibacter bethesdensis]|uniref:Uncharacterized protein n=1 Tax=Granulibacter bethesdensis TaxID=364410 RepID=A0AAC9KCW9_9PROT|nr:Hypothetical protein GbCGDNIH9_8422 [Granulibacter bethesdensis]APH61317.1 Hypothetical protein GbCGDNIH8_8422 [Granulibacter bethesdensis]
MTETFHPLRNCFSLLRLMNGYNRLFRNGSDARYESPLPESG